jgi:hypothetical protein
MYPPPFGRAAARESWWPLPLLWPAAMMALCLSSAVFCASRTLIRPDKSSAAAGRFSVAASIALSSSIIAASFAPPRADLMALPNPGVAGVGVLGSKRIEIDGNRLVPEPGTRATSYGRDPIVRRGSRSRARSPLSSTAWPWPGSARIYFVPSAVEEATFFHFTSLPGSIGGN